MRSKTLVLPAPSGPSKEMILDVHHVNMDYKTELLLYMAARRQHYVEKVLPALENGKIVLIDRFIIARLLIRARARLRAVAAALTSPFCR